MFKGTITNETITANTNIPINVKFMTNDKITYNEQTNVIEFNTPGYYDLYITLTATGLTPGNVSLTEIVNGVASTTAISSYTAGSATEIETFNINDCIRVLPGPVNQTASVSYQISSAATINSANVLVAGRR